MHSKNYYFEDDISSAQLEVTNAYHNEFLVFYYIINLLRDLMIQISCTNIATILTGDSISFTR